MLPADYALLAAMLLAILFAFLIYRLIEPGLEKLLSVTIAVPSGTTFYLRSIFLLLFLGAMGQAVSSTLDLKPGARPLEYVWAIAARLGDVFMTLFGALAIFLVLITILVATLKPRNDK